MTERPAPELYQPPLRWWSQAWRFAASLAISALVWSGSWERQWHGHRTLFWADLGVGALCFVLVLFRRRWPVTIAVLTGVAGLVSAGATGPGTLAAVSLATRRRMLPLVLVGAVGLIASMVYADMEPTNNPEPWWLTLGISVVYTFGMFAWGLYIGSRRELLWTLRQRAERAEAEQLLRTTTAREQERARIAREMHDVLAHRISQVSMLAGALAFREDLSSQEMRTHAGVIQTKANEALTDLRAVLGVLREHGTGRLVEPPQPTYGDIPALIADSREGGMTIEFEDRLDPGAVPAGVGRTLYRILQEGLTNAGKHAPGSTVLVSLAGSPEDGVDLRLLNPVGFASVPAAPGAGLGLVGLSERAALGGGRLETHVEPRLEGAAFVLHGWLPWTA